MPLRYEENVEREVSLLYIGMTYIGMTKALEWLFLTYSGESAFTKYLDEVSAKKEISYMNIKSN